MLTIEDTLRAEKLKESIDQNPDKSYKVEKFSNIPALIRCNWFESARGNSDICLYLNTSCKAFLYCGKECGPSSCETKGRQIYPTDELVKWLTSYLSF